MASEITLQYTLVPEDYLARRLALWRWSKVFLLAIIASLVTVAALLMVVQRGEVDWVAAAGAFLIAVLIVGFLSAVWALNALLTAPRRLRERFKRSPSLSRPQTLVTSDEGIYVTTDESELLLRWKLIERARVTSKMLLLLHEREVLVAIPARAFASSDACRAFLQELQRNGVNTKKAEQLTKPT